MARRRCSGLVLGVDIGIIVFPGQIYTRNFLKNIPVFTGTVGAVPVSGSLILGRIGRAWGRGQMRRESGGVEGSLRHGAEAVLGGCDDALRLAQAQLGLGAAFAAVEECSWNQTLEDFLGE